MSTDNNMQAADLPFTLLKIAYPIRENESVARTNDHANAGCSVSLRKLCVGLGHSREACTGTHLSADDVRTRR